MVDFNAAFPLYAVRPIITGIMSSVDGSALFHRGRLSLVEFTPLVELRCQAVGSPPPEVDWLRNGIVLKNFTGGRTIAFAEGGALGDLENITQSTLSLSEVQLSDAGEYSCRASSRNVSPIPGITAWTFLLEVIGELLISGRQHPKQLGL